MTRPRPRVVLFDLFGTLVPTGDAGERDEVSRRMATVLQVDPDAFAALVRSTFDDRTRGRLGGLRDTVAELAHRLDARPDLAAVDEAAELRLALTRGLLARTWALPVLAELARQRVPVGLVSDCSAETPTIWSQSTLSGGVQAQSFSCLTGHRKPESAAYRHVTLALDTTPEQCLFVGDGGSGELTGAERLGMVAVRFAQGGAAGLVDEDVDWVGIHVSDLAEILPMVVAQG